MTAMKISRRSALLGLSIAGSIAGGIGAFSLAQATRDRGLHDIILRRLGYLEPPLEVVSAFELDFRNRNPRRASHLDRFLAQPGDVLERLFNRQSMANGINRFEERICTEFLLSTNFFTEPGKSGPQLQYIGYADVYGGGCANPFARL